MSGTFHRTVDLPGKPVWRKNALHDGNVDAYMLASGNGTSLFGRVKSGTILGKLANGKVRPCLLQLATDDDTATNDVELGDVSNAFVGDVVHLVAGSTRATEFDLSGIGHNLTFTPRIPGLSVNLVVSGSNTPFSITFDAATGVLTINGATDATPDPTTTHGDVIGILLSQYRALFEDVSSTDPSTLLASVGPEPLGPVKGETIAATRTITAVDRADKIVTLSGGAFDVAEGDVLRLVDGWEPVLVSHDDIATTRFEAGELVGQELSVSGGVEGNALGARLIGRSPLTDLFLGGGVLASPAGGPGRPSTARGGAWSAFGRRFSPASSRTTPTRWRSPSTCSPWRCGTPTSPPTTRAPNATPRPSPRAASAR